MKRVDVELRWNPTARAAVCPVSGRAHVSRKGMTAFLPGGEAPIAWSAIEASDVRALRKFSRLVEETAAVVEQMSRAGRPYTPPVIPEYFMLRD